MNSKFSKHIVELFRAECRLCKTTADILEEKLKEMPGIDFIVHKAGECVDGDGKLVKTGVVKNFEEISQYFA